jgi:hypothetical protein
MPLGSICACRVQREHRSNCHAEIDNGKFHDVLPAMVSVTQGFACADLGRLNFGMRARRRHKDPAGSSEIRLHRLPAFT